MYKVEKSYNVIEGKVPDFRKIYKEDLLHGADPVLSGDLVPVKINEEDGSVTKADIAKQWYKYEDKQWANAIILTESGKEKKYSNNAEIDAEDIESYFVWIPKYRYKLWNLENYAATGINASQVHAIEIEFGLNNTMDEHENECTTPGKSNDNGECSINDWMTHPAFTAFGTNGFWVGKFETGYNSKVIIKPNVSSWRNIAIKNMFDTSYNYQRKLDSHMMKNTEWGAIAYLSHSNFGTCDSTTKACKEITPNKSAYITGYNNVAAYPNSKDASTTGNITGIFDMSGGTWEYVMSTMQNTGNSGFILGQSGFTINDIPFNSNEANYEQYYDLYKYKNGSSNDQYIYSGGILGDATSEMGPFVIYGGYAGAVTSWYNDRALSIYHEEPWYSRGGSYDMNTDTGIFSFDQYYGNASSLMAFRIVLSPTN